jgi:hypothetical protein
MLQFELVVDALTEFHLRVFSRGPYESLEWRHGATVKAIGVFEEREGSKRFARVFASRQKGGVFGRPGRVAAKAKRAAVAQTDPGVYIGARHLRHAEPEAAATNAARKRSLAAVPKPRGEPRE